MQGINDLATPFFHVFLSPFVAGDDVENCDVDLISADALAVVEADTFWCLSKLLDGIQVGGNERQGTQAVIPYVMSKRNILSRTPYHTGQLHARTTWYTSANSKDEGAYRTD